MLLSVVHNMLLVGPPGADKTLLARSVPSILPRMTIDESLDVTRACSNFGSAPHSKNPREMQRSLHPNSCVT